jgi:hypothetical protein
MGGIRSRVRFIEHRARLVRTLRDFERGKASHLPKGEQNILIACIKERIAAINVKIAPDAIETSD